ncbi:MAG: TIGR03960 family B12-binding radical SAM protein [Anaerolineaceae bacterium]|nr:TIGR03960 family B12-binding radical SAM protein [Anaerolineaceae bacterium]MDI9531607.1 TIGR03960 family B12-binding radical SAM protein [Chloroflexota bacterium]
MNTINLHQLEKILYHVEKPGRYVGGEHNQVLKDWESVQTRVCLVFPDIYDIGQPNLGLAILYDILNKQPDILAERSFAPWHDLEARLRQDHIPLFSLESKHPLSDFDVVGISLPYESLYTNALNVLDLAGIPLLAAQRTEAHPLIIAGGQACFNPEPMADFIDAFVIGEAEEVALELLGSFEECKRSKVSKQETLLKLSQIPGVYVPSLYDIIYAQGGSITRIIPAMQDVPPFVIKRIVPILPPHPTHLIVPNIETVHDRLSIEIMRGCTRGCRFCHAGIVNRPVRQRPVSEILQIIEDGLASTGYEEIGLLSLSSSDHTQILELTRAVYEKFHDRRIFVSLPSLRIASFSVELMDELRDLRPGGGFTLAPEAASPRMQAIINKPLDNTVIEETVRMIFEHGWLSLKLYYMIGLPGETLEDVQAIVDAGKRVLAIGRQIRGNRVRVHLSVGNFIPKPHTPFQWYPLNSMDELQTKLDLLKTGVYRTGIKLSYNIPETTLLEAWLSRGDRRLGRVIHRAWQLGAKFDAWGENDNMPFWRQAFTDCGLDPDFYAYRQRAVEETLPWDHIHTGVTKKHLLRELEFSQAGKTSPDCRQQCYACGILNTFGDKRPVSPLVYWGCP